MKYRGTAALLGAAVCLGSMHLGVAAQTAATQMAASQTQPARATDHASAALATLADFAWLEGTWRGPGPGDATAEIHYMAPTAGVLPAIFRLWKGETVIVLEAITLVEEDAGLTLYVRHFTPAMEPLEAERALTLRLVAREGDRFVFENVFDENPRRNVLERTGPDAFRSRSVLLRDDGSTDEIRVEYRRVGAYTADAESGRAP